MQETEKALENARKTRFRIDNMTASSYPVTEREKDVIALADAYRAGKNEAEVLRENLRVFITELNEQRILKLKEKNRADNLEAENARLKKYAAEGWEQSKYNFKCYEKEQLRCMELKEALTMIVKRDDWTSGECRHHARQALSQKSPVSRDKPGEIGMDEVDYGVFKGDSNV